MSISLFRKIVDEVGDYIFFIDFCYWGEPLLNEDLPKFITYAKKYDITTLGLFNTIETGQSCSGQITLEELGFNESCLIYSDAGQFVPQVINPEESIRFSLKNMGSDLISVFSSENVISLILWR